ncbi:MAG: alpha/beta fold hydrolase [Acidobacteria bacterium]|nr:alpha/beta fold hydrolase [Acidobacteriota bacterium]
MQTASAALEPKQLPGFESPSNLMKGCQPIWHQAGNAEAILFVHGFTGSPGDFRTFTEAYSAAGYDWFVPLLPGHGTQVEDLAKLVYRDLFDPLCLITPELLHRYKKLHLVGLSYGAVMASQLALEYPVGSLTLLAPAFFLRPDLAFKFRWIHRLGLARFYGIRPKAKGGERGTESAYSYTSVPVLPATSLFAQTQKLRKRIHQLGVEVLHIHGDKDETTPLLANREFLSASIATYKFYEVKGGLHVLPIGAQKKDIARHHLSWLKKGVL